MPTLFFCTNGTGPEVTTVGGSPAVEEDFR